MVRRMLASSLLALLIGQSTAVAWNFDWAGRVQLDALGLASSDARVRLSAVTQLAGYDPTLAGPHLLRALTDPDDQVRIEAARALGRGGVAAAAATMLEWLSDSEAAIRAAAAEVLGEIGGPEATTALIRSLGDDDVSVRQRAVAALGQRGLRGERQVVMPLVSRLEDEKAEVRRKAVEQLEALADPRAAIPLLAAFADTSLEVRKAAVRAAGVLADPVATPALVRLLRDPAEEIRTLAVGALGAIGSAEAVDTLVEQLNAGPDLFRAKVAYAIGQIAARQGEGASGRALRALVGQLARPGQRQAAYEALTAAGKVAAMALVAHLEGRAPGDPATAVSLLAGPAAGDARATPALIDELTRGRVPVPSVVAALGATGDRKALQPLLGMLEASDPALRLSTMTALRPLLVSDERTADVLAARLDDSNLEVRIVAAEHLGLLRSSLAVPRLIPLTKAAAPMRLRMAAIDALGEIADARAGAALVDILRAGPFELQRAAANALSYMRLDEPSSAQQLAPVVRQLIDLVARRSAARDPRRDQHAIRALAALARGTGDDAVSTALGGRVGDSSPQTAIAAATALATVGNERATRILVELADRESVDVRRAALRGLGELGAVTALPSISRALAAGDDRVSADAAWAVGEIASAGPTQAATASANSRIDVLFRLAQRGRWATAVNATAALARIAAVDPSHLASHQTSALRLLNHPSPLVRLNAMRLVASAASSDAQRAPAIATLVTAISAERSLMLRRAAVRATAAIGRGQASRLGTAASVLRALAKDATASDLAGDAAAALTRAPTLPARTEWRSFYVVDPDAADAPVAQAAYFLVGADDLAWAVYSDGRGEIATEHFPAGDSLVWPAHRESEL